MNISATNPLKENIAHKISNIIGNIGFVNDKEKDFSLSSYIKFLIKAVESSDPKSKSEIENHIVKLGEKAVPSLIRSLESTSGPTRGLVAMTLIRIGSSSIKALEELAEEKAEFEWVSNYIINEIKGSEIALNTVTATTEFKKVLVG